MSKRSQLRPAVRAVLGPWALVVALTVFAIAPLAYPGFFQSQSGFLAPFRAANLGALPAWLTGAGPLHADGSLPYLLAWPFVQLSGSGVVGIRWGYALALVGAALAAYAWASRCLGARGGVLAAVIYTYLPWHLGTVYVRGAYAETWLWVFWPAILWSVDHAADWARSGWQHAGLVKRFTCLAVGLLALAAAFWTLPGSAVAFCPLLAAHATLRFASRRQLLWAIAGLVIAIGASVLVARNWPVSAAPSSDDLLYPFQLLAAPLGSGQAQLLDEADSSGWSQATPVSFQLGVAAIGLSIAAIALWAGSRSRSSDGTARQAPDSGEPGPIEPGTAGHLHHPVPTPILLFWLSSLLIISLAVLRPLAGLWRVTGWHAMLSQPWQLLSLVGLPLAFLGGSAPRSNRQVASLPVWSGLAALVMLGSYADLAPRFTSVDPGPEPLALFQTEPGPAAPQIIVLDATIEAPSPVTPTLTVELTWQAIAPVSQDYSIFVHVLDTSPGEEETRIAQQDVRPCDGECPTDAWQPGDIVVTHHQLGLPAEAIERPGAGHLQLAIGLYFWQTGDRAVVVGRDDGRVILDVP